MAKIGMGDISPDLFALSLPEFLDSFTDEFKRLLLPDMSDKQIEKELTNFHKANAVKVKKNGVESLSAEVESSTKGDNTDI